MGVIVLKNQKVGKGESDWRYLHTHTYIYIYILYDISESNR